MVELIETKLGLLGDDPRVVDVAHRPQLERRVLVEEVVQALGAEGERSDRLGPVELLGDSGDDAALDEVHHAVGEQLGVHAEVAVAGQRGEDRVRDRPDAGLEGGPVAGSARRRSAAMRRSIVGRLGGGTSTSG